MDTHLYMAAVLASGVALAIYSRWHYRRLMRRGMERSPSKATEIFAIHATATEGGQVTIPSAVREMLNLGDGNQLVFRAFSDGTVFIAKEPSDEEGADRLPNCESSLLLLRMTVPKSAHYVKTGPVVVREYERQLHEVVVVPEGFPGPTRPFAACRQ